MKIRNFIKKHWKLISVCVSFALIGAIIGVSIQPVQTPQSHAKSISSGTDYKITIGEQVLAAGLSADYTCTGTSDNVVWTAAIAALPASGGIINDLTGGNYHFASTVNVPANVTIMGIGSSSNFSGASPCFNVTGNGTLFENLVVSAGGGGITTGSYTYVFNNVTIGSTVYNTSSPVATAPTGRTASYVIAASNSSATDKAQADAVCTGTSDNTTIQTALNTLTSTGAYGILHLDAGTYNFTDQVVDTTHAYVIIEGSGWGTICEWTTGINATGKYMFVIGSASNPLMRWQIRDIYIACNGTNVTGGSGVYACGDPFYMYNTKIDNFNQYGLLLDTGSAGGQIYNNEINTYPTNSGTPIDIYCSHGSGDLSIHDNYLMIGAFHNTLAEIGIRLAGTGASPNQVQTVWITHNYFDGGSNHIYGTEVANLYIRDNIFNDANGSSIYLTNTTGNFLMTGITITDNHFYDWGFGGVNSTAVGIIPQDSTYYCVGLQITGNYFDGANTPNWCINLNYPTYYQKGNISNNLFINFTDTANAVVNLSSGVSMHNNINFNPKGLITNPIGTATIGLGGSGTTVVSGTVYTVSGVDCFITSTGGGVSNIVIKDAAGNVMETGATTLAYNTFIPIDNSVTWTWTVTAPTVTVFGN